MTFGRFLNYFIIFLFNFIYLTFGQSYFDDIHNINRRNGLTKIVPKGAHSCVYEPLPAGYNVLFRARLLMPVAGFIYSLSHEGEVLNTKESKKIEYDVHSRPAGTYSLCFNNTNGYTYVTVQFQISYYREDGEISPVDEELNELEIAVQNFWKGVENIQTKVDEMYTILYYWRDFIENDRHEVIDSLHWVNLWSFLQCVIIIGTGLLQLYFIKNLFENQYEKNIYKTSPTFTSNNNTSTTAMSKLKSQMNQIFTL